MFYSVRIILKSIQLILGAVCVGIVAIKFNGTISDASKKMDLYFFSMAATFFLGTFFLLATSLTSKKFTETLSRTIYDSMFHSVAFVLLFAFSILLWTKRDYPAGHMDDGRVKAYLTAAICGVVNALVYGLNAVLAFYTLCTNDYY